MTSTSQKEKSAKSYPQRNKKKERSSKSLNDVKKSIRCFLIRGKDVDDDDDNEEVDK